MYSYNFIITKKDLKIFHKQSKSSIMMKQRQIKFITIPIILLSLTCFIALGILVYFDINDIKSNHMANITRYIVELFLLIFFLCEFIVYNLIIFIIDKKIIGSVINVELNEDKASFYGFGNKYINCSWSSFVNVYKEKNMLFLIPAKSIGKEDIFIPKRLFSTEQEFNEVFNYIKTNIDKNRQSK